MMDWDQENVERDHMVEEFFDEDSNKASSESIDEDFQVLHEEGVVLGEDGPLDNQMVK
ncbi:hypothetical protein GOP47_0029799, partial [Adiantum capillus-veneris]